MGTLAFDNKPKNRTEWHSGTRVCTNLQMVKDKSVNWVSVANTQILSQNNSNPWAFHSHTLTFSEKHKELKESNMAARLCVFGHQQYSATVLFSCQWWTGALLFHHTTTWCSSWLFTCTCWGVLTPKMTPYDSHCIVLCTFLIITEDFIDEEVSVDSSGLKAKPLPSSSLIVPIRLKCVGWSAPSPVWIASTGPEISCSDIVNTSFGDTTLKRRIILNKGEFCFYF